VHTKQLKTGWEHFSHVADQGVRGYGETLQQAFEQAALALIGLICNPADIAQERQFEIHCPLEQDRELLLADWLNAVIYEIAVSRCIFGRFQVRIDASGLSALAWGEAIDRQKHQPAVEPKGATYTELKVFQGEDGQWVAQCVVDV
jgi:SHS2 domain-containing protein